LGFLRLEKKELKYHQRKISLLKNNMFKTFSCLVLQFKF